MKFIKVVKANKEVMDEFNLDRKTFDSIYEELSNISNYGLIYFDELEESAETLGMDPIELQDIALALGYNVQ